MDSPAASPRAQDGSAPRRDAGEIIRIGVVLLIALLHGALYVLLVPPWQHYDEPAQFEFSWMIAHDRPHTADGDQQFRRAVIASMTANNFYRGSVPPDTRPGVKVSLGFDQSNGLPLQYVAASLPIRALSGRQLETQLIGARLVSLLYLLITIAAAWACTREITGDGSALRWMVPLTLATLPAFVDLMTALNDDVAAVMAFTIFLWAAARIIMRGWSIGRFLFGLAAIGLCLIAKNSTYIAVALYPLALAFALCRARLRWLPWAMIAAGLVAGAVLAFRFGDAALWYRDTAQNDGTQCGPPACQPVLGSRAIRLEAAPGAGTPAVTQLVPGEASLALAGRTVTLGAWTWACKGDCADPRNATPFEALSPALRNIDAFRETVREIGVSRTPVFTTLTVTLPAKPVRLAIKLQPFAERVREQVAVFYDGVVLAEGERPPVPPVFDDESGASGTWGGARFTNYARNGSGEAAGPYLTPQVDGLGARLVAFNNPPSSILHSLLDPAASSWYYQLTAEELFRTLWAKFGWGHVPLAHPAAYVGLLIVTALGLIGAAIVLIRDRRRLPWGVLALFALALAFNWGTTATRGVYVSLFENPWIPRARYAYPALMPTVLILTAGWRECARIAARFVPRLRRLSPNLQFALFTAAMLCLDAYAIASMVWFFAGVIG